MKELMGWQDGEKAQNCDSQLKVSYIQLFCVFLLRQYLHQTLYLCPGLSRTLHLLPEVFPQCLHTTAAQFQDGCLDRHASARIHTHPLRRHTASPHSVVLCFAPGRQNCGSHAQMKYYITTLHRGTTLEKAVAE